MSYKGTLENVKIIGGRSNEKLTSEILNKLDLNYCTSSKPLTVSPGVNKINYVIDDFANGEINFCLKNEIMGKDIFVIQTGYTDVNCGRSINDYIMELMFFLYYKRGN